MAAKGSKGDYARNELIRVGGTVHALSEMFARDAASVKRMIAQHRIPCVVNGDGHELYAVRDVAPYLVDLNKAIDVEQVLKTTTLKKLPPELSKNFWEAYNARKKALEDDKQLWRTEAVMEVFLDVFTVLRQSINQFVDTVADRTKVTAEQQKEIEGMCDGLIASMREKLLDTFELYEPSTSERFEEAQDEREREIDEFDD